MPRNIDSVIEWHNVPPLYGDAKDSVMMCLAVWVKQLKHVL